MNKWECDHKDPDTQQRCRNEAVGTGGAIGLRAIGWYFVPGGPLLCPGHRPDAHGDCRDPYRSPDDAPGPNPCPRCTADEEAERFQGAIAMVLRIPHEPRDTRPRTFPVKSHPAEVIAEIEDKRKRLQRDLARLDQRAEAAMRSTPEAT